ncbi:MAG TPA: carboxypeptidase-like regulatory domain-containing protein [Mucilaginibacter sp.]|nr:carboxypeptidase-like regulatory domain-containing protein [Mucilaginibacter sp.]
MRHLLCTLLLLAGFCAKAQNTFFVGGTVTDKKGEIIAGATVFITNSRYITSTDSKGQFFLNAISSGSYEIVIKMLGFDTFIQSISVNNKPVNISAVLTESNTMLNTVNVTAFYTPDKYMRPMYLDLFIRNFIGRTDNAQQCKLLNSDIIKFRYNKETHNMVASANDFLIIENAALGYRIKYLLTRYEYNGQTKICTIGGAPYFEELKGTTKQQKEWEKNRRIAYLGSDRHFFRMVMNNSTVQEAAKEGFIIFKVPDTTGNSKIKEQKVKKDKIDVYRISIDTTFIKNAGGFKTLLSKPKIPGNDSTRTGYLIIYTKEKESPLFYKTGVPLEYEETGLVLEHKSTDSPKRQISRIYPLADTIKIDKNGSLTPVLGFRYDGYWAWKRIADLTPLDYFVEPEK